MKKNVYNDSFFRLGSDPEKLFPFSLMQEQLRKCGTYGLVTALQVQPVLTSDQGSGVDLDEAAVSMTRDKDTKAFDSFMPKKSNDKFNKRMRGVVADMVRLGYV